jgi:hypothetical protein
MNKVFTGSKKSLGKGEVESSILSGSTIISMTYRRSSTPQMTETDVNTSGTFEDRMGKIREAAT